MPGFNDVLERLVTDAEFRGALAADPARALAGYDLTPTELELLAFQVTEVAGMAGAVETRTSKASLVGFMDAFGEVAEALAPTSVEIEAPAVDPAAHDSVPVPDGHSLATFSELAGISSATDPEPTQAMAAAVSPDAQTPVEEVSLTYRKIEIEHMQSAGSDLTADNPGASPADAGDADLIDGAGAPPQPAGHDWIELTSVSEHLQHAQPDASGDMAAGPETPSADDHDSLMDVGSVKPGGPDDDGDSDGADFLAWQRQLDQNAADQDAFVSENPSDPQPYYEHRMQVVVVQEVVQDGDPAAPDPSQGTGPDTSDVLAWDVGDGSDTGAKGEQIEIESWAPGTPPGGAEPTGPIADVLYSAGGNRAAEVPAGDSGAASPGGHYVSHDGGATWVEGEAPRGGDGTTFDFPGAYGSPGTDPIGSPASGAESEVPPVDADRPGPEVGDQASA